MTDRRDVNLKKQSQCRRITLTVSTAGSMPEAGAPAAAVTAEAEQGSSRASLLGAGVQAAGLGSAVGL